MKKRAPREISLKLSRWLSLRGRGRTVVAVDEQSSPLMCDNVKVWCEQQENSLCWAETVLEPKSLTRKFPHTIEPNIHERFLERHYYTIPEKYLARISKVRLVGKNGLVILPDGSVSVETMYSRERVKEDLALQKWPTLKTRKMPGSYYSLLMLWGWEGNYYHWLHDVLLRLHEIINRLPKDVLFISPPKLKPFQIDSLRVLGIDPEQLVFFSGDEIWELEELYYSPPTARTGHSSAAALDWFRQKTSDAYGINPGGHRRIFISREMAARRAIANMDEIRPVLDEYDIEVWKAETLSFRDQADLFSQAELIVSTHGAGLTNVLFAKSGTQVLEIFEPNYILYTYWTMCDALQHDYWYFVGETGSNRDGGSRADVIVSPEKLRTALTKLVL